MSRPAKIALLPHALRETLNHRLLDGEPGPRLLAWLNAEPAVQAVLDDRFDGRPINPQNLSEWRHGGHTEWRRQRQILDLAARLHEEPEALAGVTGEALTERVAQAVALTVAGELRAAEAMKEGPAKLHAVLAVVRAVDRLRQMDNRSQRARRAESRHARQALRRSRRGQPRAQRADLTSAGAEAFALARLAQWLEGNTGHRTGECSSAGAA